MSTQQPPADAGSADAQLKARHRAMWASGDYPSMVETFLLPLGPRLVEACGIGAGMRVLDVGAGTGNASIPAARARRRGHRQRPHARAARGGPRARAEASGLELDWVEADAERLPFDDASFDVVMSSIGAMFAPHHQDGRRRARARLPSRRHDRAAELDARGDDRRAVPHDGAVRPAAPARRAAPAAVGQRGPPRASCSATASSSRTLEREVLEVTAFARPRDYGEHFKARYGPTIAARANAAQATGARREFDDGARRGSATSGTGARADAARFEMEYLLAVGTRA